MVRSLHAGGTERQLIALAQGLSARGVDVRIAVFYGGGELEPALAQGPGVPLINLRKGGRWDLVGFAARLARAVADASPDVIYGFLPGAFEASLWAGRRSGARVVWGIRSSFVDHSAYDWLHVVLHRFEGWMSHMPDRIIVNSAAGLDVYGRAGYDTTRMVVVPNGVDGSRWFPVDRSSTTCRARWGIPEDAVVAGLVGRLDPMKDHVTFLRAIAMASRTGLHAACIGSGPEAMAARLHDEAASLGIGERVHLVGGEEDMRAAYAALDLLVSSSVGEGFSNVLGEAMACGVPCAVTDVGDSRVIVGELGEVAPARDPRALAVVIDRLVARRSPALSAACREAVLSRFSVEQMVERTLKELEELE